MQNTDISDYRLNPKKLIDRTNQDAPLLEKFAHSSPITPKPAIVPPQPRGQRPGAPPQQQEAPPAAAKGPNFTTYVNENLSHLCPMHCGLSSYRSINTRVIAGSNIQGTSQDVLKEVLKIKKYHTLKSSQSQESANDKTSGSPSTNDDMQVPDEVLDAGVYEIQGGNSLTLWDYESPLVLPPLCTCEVGIATSPHYRKWIDTKSKIDEEQHVNTICQDCGALLRFPLTFISIQATRELQTVEDLISKVPLPDDCVTYSDPNINTYIVIICFTVEHERLIRGALKFCDLDELYQVYDVCSQYFVPYVNINESLKRNIRLVSKHFERHCAKIKHKMINEAKNKISSILENTPKSTKTESSFCDKLLTECIELPWFSTCESVPERQGELNKRTEDFVFEMRPIPPNYLNIVHIDDVETPMFCKDAFAKQNEQKQTEVQYAWCPRPYCIRPRIKIAGSCQLSTSSFLANYLHADFKDRLIEGRKILPKGCSGVVPFQSCSSLGNGAKFKYLRWNWSDSIGTISFAPEKPYRWLSNFTNSEELAPRSLWKTLKDGDELMTKFNDFRNDQELIDLHKEYIKLEGELNNLRYAKKAKTKMKE